MIGDTEDVLYVVALTPESGYEDVFNEWYDTEHVPELLGCDGFRSARRYEAIERYAPTSPRYLATYQVSDMTAFEGETYQRLRRRSRSDRTALAQTVQDHLSVQIRAAYAETRRW